MSNFVDAGARRFRRIAPPDEFDEIFFEDDGTPTYGVTPQLAGCECLPNVVRFQTSGFCRCGDAIEGDARVGRGVHVRSRVVGDPPQPTHVDCNVDETYIKKASKFQLLSIATGEDSGSGARNSLQPQRKSQAHTARGQYRKETLLDLYGPDVTMPDLLHLIAKCEYHGNMTSPCGVRYGDLLPHDTA